MTQEKRADVAQQLKELINRNSLENESNTPDHVLAAYLLDCIDAQTRLTRCRDNWFGGAQSILDSEKGTQWTIS